MLDDHQVNTEPDKSGEDRTLEGVSYGFKNTTEANRDSFGAKVKFLIRGEKKVMSSFKLYWILNSPIKMMPLRNCLASWTVSGRKKSLHGKTSETMLVSSLHVIGVFLIPSTQSEPKLLGQQAFNTGTKKHVVVVMKEPTHEKHSRRISISTLTIKFSRLRLPV